MLKRCLSLLWSIPLLVIPLFSFCIEKVTFCTDLVIDYVASKFDLHQYRQRLVAPLVIARSSLQDGIIKISKTFVLAAKFASAKKAHNTYARHGLAMAI